MAHHRLTGLHTPTVAMVRRWCGDGVPKKYDTLFRLPRAPGTVNILQQYGSN